VTETKPSSGGSARTGGDERAAQLTAVIARQQRELEAVRARAAADAVVNLARGVLMERLHCSPGEAAAQLTRLADAVGTPLVAFAAEVLEQSGDDQAADAPPAPKPPQLHRVRLAEAAVEIAADGAQVATAVFEEALAPAGAVAAAIWMIEPDGALQLAGQVGLGPLETSRWQRIPPQLDCLAQRTAQQGVPRWVPAMPLAPDPTPQVGGWRGARAVLPLTDAGTLTGVMEICWPTPLARFTPALQHELLAMADVCARGLRGGGDASRGHAAWLPALLDGLCRSVLLAHAVRDDEGRVVDFHIDHVSEDFADPAGRSRPHPVDRRLLHVYPLAAVPGGLFDHAVTVLRTGRPFRARDLAVHDVVGDTGGAHDAGAAATTDVRIVRYFDGVAITWQPTGEAGRLAALLGHAERLGHLGGWQEDLRTGDVYWTERTFTIFRLPPTAEPVRLVDLDVHVHVDDVDDVAGFRRALLDQRRPAAAAFRLVRAGGETRHLRVSAEPVADETGTVVAVRGAYQDLSARYHTQLALAVARDRLTDSEQRADDRHRLALRLQKAIVPPTQPQVDAAGLDVAVRYRPAQHLVGGDWHDTVALPSGEVLLVVGDIAGHGIDAVTGMVALRNSLRGLAMTGARPGRLLSWLNRVACQLTDDVTATAVCGLYEPAARTLRWARAGHLPPVLVRDGLARTLPPPDGLLLGVDTDTAYDELSVSLRPGDGLLLFTDGLIERRGASLDDALEVLLEAAGEPAADVQHRADEVLRRTTPDTDDDTCLIVINVR
jgi:serine phosphatase RsbU (regulator of sigma subunit)